MIAEHAWIAGLRERLGPAGEGVLVGVGDDAAVLSPASNPLVWTIDAAVEGVHFTFDIADAYTVGYRSLMAAASDLAAMGASPRGVLSALTLPHEADEQKLDELVRGQRAAAELLHTAVIGGNVSRGPCWSVSTTVLGEAKYPLLRSGARAGDRIWVAGPLGHASAGLRLLLSRASTRSNALDFSPDERACVDAWSRPLAQIEAGLRLAGRATSAIDVSDGLAQDLGHIARASRVDIELAIEAVISESPGLLTRVASALGVPADRFAVSGGEDYALVVSSPDSLSNEGFRAIGRVVDCGANEPEVRVFDGTRRIEITPGFDHGR